MLNRAAKLALVSTSLAPICLTLWFVEFSKNWNWREGLGYLAVALMLSLLCSVLIRTAANKLETLPVKIKSIRTADKEIVGFLLVYLLPLIKQAPNSIQLPVLLFGYHFYEATIEGDITFVLITQQSITHCKNISKVVQLTEYMILDVNHAR